MRPGFSAMHRQRQCSFYRVCVTCEVRKACYRCKAHKAAEEYTASAWKARNANRRVCRDCAAKFRGSWTCQACRRIIPQSNFQAFLHTHPAGRNGTQVCDACRRATALKRHATRATGRLKRHRASARKREVLEAVRREVTAIVRARSQQRQAMPGALLRCGKATQTTPRRATPPEHMTQTKENERGQRMCTCRRAAQCKNCQKKPRLV